MYTECVTAACYHQREQFCSGFAQKLCHAEVVSTDINWLLYADKGGYYVKLLVSYRFTKDKICVGVLRFAAAVRSVGFWW